MVNNSVTLDNVYFALSSDIRRRLLEYIALRPVSLSELAANLRLSLPALYKHTRVLQVSRLATKKKVGRVTYLVLEPGSLAVAESWISAHEVFWKDNLDSLDAYFNNK